MKNTFVVRIRDEFLYGGHVQALGAGLLAASSTSLLGIAVTWDLVLLSYFLFYSFYIFNRFREIEIDEETNTARTKHIRLYMKYVPLMLAGSIGTVLSLTYVFPHFEGKIFILVVLVFGLLYTNTFKNLTRHIPLFKNAYVAAFFALLLILPGFYYGTAISSIVLLFAVFVFLKTLGMQMFLDIKDTEGDRQQGLQTLSVMIGPDRTRRFLLGYSFVVSLFFSVFIPILFFSFFHNIVSDSLVRKGSYGGYVFAATEFVLWPLLIATIL